ncbi:hypothetical protein Tco_1532849 [Tanacetum coccineum]
MVRVESLSDDQLTVKMSVLHCMMMSHRGLNQSHHEYVLSTDSRLKGYEEKVASLTVLELQVSTLKKQVSGLNDKLATSDASFAKSKAKGKERKKKIKSLSKSLDNLHSEVARLSTALNQATILEAERDEEILRLKATPPKSSSFFRGQFQGLVWKFLAFDKFSRVQGELLSLAASNGFERELSMHRTKDKFAGVLKKMVNFMHGAQDRIVEASPLVAQNNYAFLNKISERATKPLSVILQLELEKLACPDHVPTLRDTRASPPIAKESTVTPVSKSLELYEVAAVESERISSSPTNVVVALFADGKGDVLIPSSVAGEEGRGAWYAGEHLLLRACGKLTVDAWLSIQRILSHATHPKPNGFPLGSFSKAGQAFVGSMGCIFLSEADIMLLCLALELVWLPAR